MAEHWHALWSSWGVHALFMLLGLLTTYNLQGFLACWEEMMLLVL